MFCNIFILWWGYNPAQASSLLRVYIGNPKVSKKPKVGDSQSLGQTLFLTYNYQCGCETSPRHGQCDEMP